MINKTIFSMVVTFSIAVLLISLAWTNAFAIYKMSLPNLGFGPIASINQDWILSGHWVGHINPSNLKESGFHSTFHMVKNDGSSPHIHKIYNATATQITKQGNNTIIKGTVSITMKDGPVDNVPTTFTIGNNNTIAISMDQSKLNNHFGNTPIYGLFNNYKDKIHTLETMFNGSVIMNKLSPLLKHGLTGGDNMSK